MRRRTRSRYFALQALVCLVIIATLLPLGGGGLGGLVALADPASPLAVTKTASPSPVASGAEITYTITVVNTGGAKVDNVVLTDQINGVGGFGDPPQLVLTSSRGSCSQSALKVTCLAGSIEGRGSWTVTIRGVVTAANGTTLNNTASVTGTKSAQNFTTTATVQTLVQNGSPSPLADLTISKTGPSSVVISSTLTYILTVNNIGNANAVDIRVVDTLPAGVGLVSVNANSLFLCTSAGTPVTVTCDGGRINQGYNATITINATAPASPGQIANTAVVDPNNTIPESNELNNTSATISTSVTSAPAPQGLIISKTDFPDPVVPGAILSYTVIVTNTATSRADDVTTVDGTQGLEAASVTASQVVFNGAVGTNGGCTVAAPQVTCSIRSLDPGGTQTIVIKGQVIASAGSMILNTATATANIKNQGVTATATAQTTVKPAVELSITKADSPDPVCARSWPTKDQHLPNAPSGLSAASDVITPTLLAPPVCLGGLTYNFIVGNSGIMTASGVTVRDPLPAGLIFDSYVTNGGFTCAVDAANVVTCDAGTIPPESTKFIKFLMVAPPNTGTIVNTVTVDPNNAIYESDETNNTFTQATDVKTGIDLVVRKDDSPVDPPGAQNVTEGFDPIATRGTETYVITVDNVGTQDVTGIRLEDTLPADTVFLSVIADPTHGFTCSQDGSPTGGKVVCIGGHLLGTESEFYDPPGTNPAPPGDDIATIKIRVFARHDVGAMHNEVRVDPLGEIPEANELNNSETEDTTVTNGGFSLNAYNELKIKKEQTSPVDGSGNAIPVATNGVITYTITVWNDATDPVGQSAPVVVKDTLPQGFRYIEARDTMPGPDGFQCVQGANVQEVTCTGGGPLSGMTSVITPTGGSVALPVTRTITVKAFAADAPSGGGIVYTNQADVDPNNTIPEGDEFNNRVYVTTTVAVGGANMFNELTISKTDFPDPVATSSVVTYTIVVTNTGTDPAFNVVVRDTLPAGFVYIEATDTAPGPQAFICTTAPGNVVNCTGATLSGTVNAVGGQPTSRTIILKAFSSTMPGMYTNTAIVDPDNTIPEGNETNNMAQATTQVIVGAGFIDLVVTKTGTISTTPGSLINYSLLVANNGTDPAFNVTVRDDLPAGTTFVSAVDSAPGAGAFTCGHAGGVVTCTGGTLDGSLNLIPGPPDIPTSRVINVQVLAPTNIQALVPESQFNNIVITITNQVLIDPGNAIPESNETNNSSSVTTTVQSAINLTLDKTGPNTATQNSEADYVLTVKNEGTAPAFGVEVRDPLPVGLIPLSIKADPTNFACQLLENPVNVVECVGDLGAKGASDDTVTITIHVFVTANGGPLDNEACVDPANKIEEFNELDNCKTKTTTIVPLKPDLLINKSADSTTVTAGQSLTYRLLVSNVGLAATTSPVVVTDFLTPAVTLVNTNPGGDFTCSGTTTITCTSNGGLGVGQSVVIEILTTVSTTVTAPFTNTAQVSIDPGGELDTTNNGPVTITTGVGGSPFDFLVFSLEDDPDPVAPGGILTYKAKVMNVGSASASGVLVRTEVTATPGVTLTHLTSGGSNGFSCIFATFVDCTGNLPSLGETVITMLYQVTGAVPPDGVVTATTTVDPAGAFAESNEGNNQQVQPTTVHANCSSCIDLVTSAIFGSPDPVAKDNYVTFSVGVGNAGTQASGAFSVTLTLQTAADVDFEPGGFTATQPSPDYTASGGFDCTASGNVVTCGDEASSDPGLQPGEGVLFTLKVHVKSTALNGSVSLEAKADSTFAVSEFSESNNTRTGSVGILP